MLVTVLLSLMMMAGLFLLLWGGVGFIQDKKFMSSAPKEALAVVPDRMPERFKGQYAVGYAMVTVAFSLSSSVATGLPTSSPRPTTRACLPSMVSPVVLIRWMQARGVHGAT